ncbi:hypothetical protein LCGC14_1977830 [marine sediment metagenome]|uniref:Uncharacterized protein n=1 Tax=marine sediment metagenome TaxID=412755 RepID=A0A0F9F9R7_9ZZZZ
MKHKKERIEYDCWVTCDVCGSVTTFGKHCYTCDKDLCSDCSRKRYVGIYHYTSHVEDGCSSWPEYYYFCEKDSKNYKSPRGGYPGIDPATRKR